MLVGYILLFLFIFSTLFSPVSGSTQAAGAAVMEGAEEALRFCIALSGGVCLWSGVMELMERCGISAALARALGPLLKRLFPNAGTDRELMAAVSENVSANLLGLGNAAPPAGIRAARAMAGRGGPASDELCLFVVLNTASIQLIPTTIASLRSAEGAAAAFDIMPAVWISSVLSVCAGLLAAALLRRFWV